MISGFAKEIITPKLSLPMAGYIGLRKSTGVLDDLHVRCIYLKQEEEVFLFQYDLLYIDQVLCNLLIDQLCCTYPIKREQVIVSAIHTHSGPAQILDKSGINQRLAYIDGGYDQELVSMLVQKGVQAAQKAYSSKDEAVLQYGAGHFRDIGTNRNQKDQPIDDTLTVVKIKQKLGKEAIIFSYACHPTIFHEENTCYSCDLLAETFYELERDVEVAMFYNGACGDVSTRYTKQSSSIAEAKRLGLLLANHVKDLQKHMIPVIETLSSFAYTYTCSTRAYPSQEIIMKYDMQCTNEKEKELLQLYEMMASYLKEQKLNLPVRILLLGQLRYVYVPVELFSRLSLLLKELLNKQEIILVSYAMDYFSYMPDAAAYDEVPIGFEAVISPFAKGCGEHFIEDIAHRIKAIEKSLTNDQA